MIDIRTLRCLKHKKNLYAFDKDFFACLNRDTCKILDLFFKYFKNFPSHNKIDPEFFETFLKSARITSSEKENETLLTLVKKAWEDENNISEVLTYLKDIQLSLRVQAHLEKFQLGESGSFAEGLYSITKKHDPNSASVRHLHYSTQDLMGLENCKAGILWRLKCLNDAMRPLRPGDFGLIAARPDRGKTTFLASEISYLSRQLPKDRNVVWFNNEGPGSRILLRLRQAALGVSWESLKSMAEEGSADSRYEESVGGKDKVRVFDVHGKSFSALEKILQDNSPGIVIYDMLDSVQSKSEYRQDLALEGLYKLAREACVRYNCVGLASSQVSYDGDGIMYPGMHMLKDSKTGKQGACDFIMIIGHSNDPGLSQSRFLSLPKNKLRNSGMQGNLLQEVNFRPDICRYEDLETS